MNVLLGIYEILLILIFAAAVSAQTITFDTFSTDQNAASIEWKLYKVSAADSALKFPKLPVRSDEGDLCRETQASIYNAYADQVVYEFRYYAKSNEPIPSYCLVKERFGQEMFERRLAELRNSNPAPISEQDIEINWRKVKLYKWKTPNEIVTRWVLPDMGNKRWREMQISYRPDKKPDEKLFVNSLVFSSKDGIEINTGNPTTLGDKGLETKSVPTSTSGTEQSDALLIKSKARPPYTDLARDRNTIGAVLLRVTFLANGGIGPVTVVNELPNGLTQEAILASKKIVFLPKRVNGVPMNVVKLVEYKFSIY
jgi:hypothetical protein